MLLYNRLPRTTSRVVAPTYIYMQELIKKNLSLVYKRIHASADFVKSEHLLVKLLGGLNINRGLSTFDIIYAAADKSYSLARILGATSIESFGDVTSGFFTKDAEEFILFHTEAFSIEPWQTLQPVKFAWHNETNMNCKMDSTLAFITINVPMLAHMYVEWDKYCSVNNLFSDIKQFIAKWVLPNALPSYIDISLFNRYHYAMNGIEIPVDSKFRTITLMDYEPFVKRIVDHRVDHLDKGASSIANALYETQLIFRDSAYDLMKPIDLRNTIQCRWFSACSQMPYILYGLDAAYKDNHSMDSGVISTMIREMNALKNSKFLSRLSGSSGLVIMENLFNPLYDKLLDAE